MYPYVSTNLLSAFMRHLFPYPHSRRCLMEDCRLICCLARLLLGVPDLQHHVRMSCVSMFMCVHVYLCLFRDVCERARALEYSLVVGTFTVTPTPHCFRQGYGVVCVCVCAGNEWSSRCCCSQVVRRKRVSDGEGGGGFRCSILT